MNFAEVTPKYYNLNGKGEPTHPQEIYYENVAVVNDRQVDLRVTNPNGDYDCDDCTSVMSGEFGKINCKSGNTFEIHSNYLGDIFLVD